MVCALWHGVLLIDPYTVVIQRHGQWGKKCAKSISPRAWTHDIIQDENLTPPAEYHSRNKLFKPGNVFLTFCFCSPLMSFQSLFITSNLSCCFSLTFAINKASVWDHSLTTLLMAVNENLRTAWCAANMMHGVEDVVLITLQLHRYILWARWLMNNSH